MYKIILTSTFSFFILTSFTQYIYEELIGVWSNKNNETEIKIVFSKDGSYKMENWESRQLGFPIKVGNWQASKDTLYLWNMDAIDKQGKSLYTDTNILYHRDNSMRIKLKNDTLVFYEKLNAVETENVFIREKQ